MTSESNSPAGETAPTETAASPEVSDGQRGVIVTIRSSLVNAEVADIWAVLADFDRISGWAENVDHSCLLTHGSIGFGTVRRIQSGPLTVTEEVTIWEPLSKLSYRIDGLPPIVKKVTNTWTLVEKSGGSTMSTTDSAMSTTDSAMSTTEAAAPVTEVTLTTRITPGPKPPHKLASKVLAKKLAQASDQMLAGIALVSEAASKSTGGKS